MDMRLEVVVLPVSDVDRAKKFYQGLGWRLDGDYPFNENFRVVQLTPPGSASSIIFGKGITAARPGSADGLHLVVDNIDAARTELAGRGAKVSDVFHDAIAPFHHAGTAQRVPGPAPNHQSYGSWLSFADPDGNNWFVQEITTRLPGRSTSALAVYGSVASLALRSVVPRRHMASTSRRSAGATRTGPTGTRSTWWTSRRNRTRRHERVAAISSRDHGIRVTTTKILKYDK